MKEIIERWLRESKKPRVIKRQGGGEFVYNTCVLYNQALEDLTSRIPEPRRF